jgi:hypothetical protein
MSIYLAKNQLQPLYFWFVCVLLVCLIHRVQYSGVYYQPCVGVASSPLTPLTQISHITATKILSQLRISTRIMAPGLLSFCWLTVWLRSPAAFRPDLGQRGFFVLSIFNRELLEGQAGLCCRRKQFPPPCCFRGSGRSVGPLDCICYSHQQTQPPRVQYACRIHAHRHATALLFFALGWQNPLLQQLLSISVIYKIWYFHFCRRIWSHVGATKDDCLQHPASVRQPS